jgi:hypothetical protein
VWEKAPSEWETLGYAVATSTGPAGTSLLHALEEADGMAGASLEHSYYRDSSHETRDRCADAAERRFARASSVYVLVDIDSGPHCPEEPVSHAEPAVHVRDGGLAEPGFAFAAVPAATVLRACPAHSGAPPVQEFVDAVVLSCPKY